MQQHTFLAPLPHLRLRPSALAVRLALAGLMVAGTSAGAQEQATEKTLAEITVSASADASAEGLTPSYAGNQVARGGRVGLLGNQDIMDTPFSTTAYTSELMRDQQAKSVADVLQNDPGVRLARGFGNFQELYMIRGFNVYSDDMSYNGLYGLLPRQYVATELLERVEVFRGASAFLNGAAPNNTAIGGTVSVLPKRAGNEPLSQVMLGANSGGGYEAAVDLSRRFGDDQASGLRLNVARRDGGTGVEDEERELSLLALGWDWRSRNVRLSADLGYQEHNLTQPRPSVTPNGVVPSPPDASKNYAQSWTYSDAKDTFGTVRAEVDFAEHLTGWAAVGAREGREDNVLAGPTVNNANGDMTFTRADNVREDSVRTGEVGLRGKVSTGPVKHAWAASASIFSSKERNAAAWSGGGHSSNLYNPVDIIPAPAATGGWSGGQLNDPLVVGRIDLTSVALADTLGFAGDTILVTLGARHQEIRNRSYDYNTGAESSDYQKSKATPMAGVVFKATQQVSLYANYIEGLTKGATADATHNSAPVTNPGETLKPYVSKQKEIGAKYDGNGLGAGVAVFSTAKSFGMYDSNNTFTDGGEQRNQGVELSVFGQPTNGLRLLGGVTFLDAEITNSEDASLVGKKAIGVPEYQLNLGADADVPGVRGLAVNARVLRTASQYANADNTMSIPAWTRLDLGARYITQIGEQAVTFRARIDNVTNEAYWASVGGYPDSNYLVQGAPRTLTVSATIDF